MIHRTQVVEEKWRSCEYGSAPKKILTKTDKDGFSPAVFRSSLEQKIPVTEYLGLLRLCFVFYDN